MISPAIPPVGPASRPALAPMEGYYLRALVHWYRHKREPPSLGDLADLCRRSGAPTLASGMSRPRGWPSRRAIRFGLMGCVRKGYAKLKDGKFEVIK